MSRPVASGDAVYFDASRTCRPASVSTEGALALARVLAHELLRYRLQEPCHAER